jgi:Spy/CpxP family protein refolding chaperone
MKKNSRRHKLRFASLLTASSLCALTVFAQPAPDEKPGNRPPAGRQFPRGDRPGGGFQPGGMGGGQFLPMLQRVLTEEQRTSLRSAMEAQREQARALEEKLRDARRELLKASVLDPFDEDGVRSKALEVGKLDAEMTVLRAKAFSQMKPALSKEQIEELRNPPPMDGGGNRGENFSLPGHRPAGPRDENDLPVPRPKAR